MSRIKYSMAVAIVLALATVAGLAGCKSHRTNQSTQTSTHGGGKTMPARHQPETLALSREYKPWTTLYAPFNIRVSKPTGITCSGRATMVYGQAMHLSMRVLGLEVAVAYADTDSAYVLDKVHRKAYVVPLGALTAATNITLADLQGVLLGQAVYPGRGILYADIPGVDDWFSVNRAQQGGYTYTPRRSWGPVAWQYVSDDTPVLTALGIAGDDPGKAIAAIYGDVQPTGAGAAASAIDIQGQWGKTAIDAALTWNFAKAEWNTPRTLAKPSLLGYETVVVLR